MTDENQSETPNGVPDLFEEFERRHNQFKPSVAAQMIQAEAMARMAALQQAQYELQTQAVAEKRQMQEELSAMTEELFSDIDMGDAADDYRVDDDDDPDFQLG